MIDYIEKAKAFAMMAHKGQTDKAGEDYFTAHVAVVADGVEPDPLVKAAAYLHDTVEDTGTTIDTIRAEFPPEVAEAVSVLTREKDMTYAEYIWREPDDGSDVKVYDQKRPVEYADYKPGMLYVSVYEVFPTKTTK